MYGQTAIKTKKVIKLKYIFLTLISSFLISTSLFLDKVILKSTSTLLVGSIEVL